MPDQDLFAGRSVAVFDAYGTLFDVHSAVSRHAGAIGPEAERFSEVWRTKQLEYSWVLGLMGRYASFWSLTERALDFAFAQHPGVDAGLRPSLLDAYRSLDAYPEVAATLRSLRSAGIRTAILSNGDATMLDRAISSAELGDCLDATLSVDPVATFKTNPIVYRLVLDHFAVTAEEVVFCSSNRWDIAGAAAFGFTPVWVNRQGKPDEYRDLPPNRVVSALDALV